MQLLGSTRIRTTAYHPAANGLIERFHRQLKASLKACPDPTHWVDSLPLVLLGVRTAVKEDLSCSAAELVYGTTLRLPGEFFSPVQDDITVDPADFVTRLKVSMQQLKASPVREQQSRKVYISKDMSSSTHVFVRRDAVLKPLQQPYDGPFKILKRSDKHFTLDIHGHQEVVSLDRLKPAHLDNSHPESPSSIPVTSSKADESASPPIVTRRGRHVRFPARLDL